MTGNSFLKKTILCLTILSLTAPAAVLAAEERVIRQWVDFSADALEFGSLLGFDTVTYGEAPSMIEPGSPMLPKVTVRVAVPGDMSVTSISVIDAKSRSIAGKFNILPAQHPRHRSATNSPERLRFVEPDAFIYGSAEPFPGNVVEVTGQADLAGQGIVEIDLYPVQYIPSEQRLVLYEEVGFDLTLRPGRIPGDRLRTLSEKARLIYTDALKNQVINPQDVSVKTSDVQKLSALPSDSYDYVIITSSLLSSAFEDLRDWKTRKGLRARIVTTGEIQGWYGGAGANDIREFIEDAHSDWGTLYFLLGGESTVIGVSDKSYIGDQVTGDSFYSDYDSDWTNEVYVGRTPVDNASEVAYFTTKVLNYEKSPQVSNYPLEVLLMGMDLDSYTECEDLMETIDGYIPSRFSVTKVYDSHGGDHLTNFKNAINGGVNLVTGSDHGDTTVHGVGSIHHNDWMDLTDIGGLSNGGNTNLFATDACYVNNFDETGDAFGERYVLQSGRAGHAFIGNTRYGWYSQGNCNSLSGKLLRLFWQGIFSYGQYRQAGALNHAKHSFSHSDDYSKYCEYEWTLIGDPESPIWTETPTSMSLSHPPNLIAGPVSFSVTVTEAKGPVEGATVCLWKAGEVFLTGITNSSGQVTLTPSPISSGTMYVTADKWNYIPAESSAEVGGGTDNDSDGYPEGIDCDDNDPDVYPGADEDCGNGIDDDCDDFIDDNDIDCCWDDDGDGFKDELCNGTDCDDSDAAVNPAAAEDCDDGIDNDCDGQVDLDDANCQCTDYDGDGYGYPASPFCEHPEMDCNDSNDDINPGQPEIQDNGVDDDCDPATPDHPTGGCIPQTAEANAAVAGSGSSGGGVGDILHFFVPILFVVMMKRRITNRG